MTQKITMIATEQVRQGYTKEMRTGVTPEKGANTFRV